MLHGYNVKKQHVKCVLYYRHTSAAKILDSIVSKKYDICFILSSDQLGTNYKKF